MNLINIIITSWIPIKMRFPKRILFLFFFLGNYSMKFLSMMGFAVDERVVEHPYIMRNVKLPKKARVLDVGCCDSLLSHALVSRGYEVWGIDIRSYPEAHPYMKFVQDDLMDTHLPNDFFDAVMANSVIEHIGLSSPQYDDPIKNDGDIVAMESIRRVLKQAGLAIVTIPYSVDYDVETSGVIHRRKYDEARITRLTSGFALQQEELFVLIKNKWLKLPNRNLIRNLPKDTEAIICLTLRKL